VTPRPSDRASDELVAITKAYDLVRELTPRVGKFQRRLKELTSEAAAGTIRLEDVKASIASWIGHLQHGDTWGLRRRLLEAAVFRPGGAPDTEEIEP